MRRKRVQLFERPPHALVLPLCPAGMSAIDNVLAGMKLTTDGSEVEREETPEPRLLLVREAVFTIGHIPPEYVTHYWSIF